MKKEKVFRMEFAPSGVNLYEEIRSITGAPVLIQCGIMADVAAAKVRARELCPDGCRVRLLLVQR